MLSDVREQDLGVTYLRRVVDGSLTSPLLLVGEEGVGRRFSSLQACKELFCTGDRSSTCRCVDCLQVDEGTHPDLVVVRSVDDKDIGVEAIRSVVEQTMSYPSAAPLKLFVIDGADRLTVPAANAILKTLEEPPATVRFILLAESPNGVIPTVRSRCGLVVYSRLSEPFVVSVVQRFEPDPAKALVISRIAEGSVGRAVQYWGSGRLSLRDKMFTLLKHGLNKDVASLFIMVDSIGTALPLSLRFLEHLLLDLRMVRITPAHVMNLDLADELRQMSGALRDNTWHELVAGLRQLRDRYRAARIVLPFHVKTLFATAFFGS